MKEINKTTTIQKNGWTLKISPPVETQHTRMVVMLHGWTGDEDSMQIFRRNVPKNRWVIAPRGILATGEGGYGWISHRPGRDATLQTFIEIIDQLRPVLWEWHSQLKINDPLLELIGFSQGAGLCLAYALSYPQDLARLVCISGFLPHLPEPFDPPKKFENIAFFVSHGTRDDTVPVERARELKNFLLQNHAVVNYCEDNVGHRISARCFKQLGEFFESADPVN